MTYNHYGKDIVLAPGLEDSYTVPKNVKAIKTFWVALKPAMEQVIESHPRLVQSTMSEDLFAGFWRYMAAEDPHHGIRWYLYNGQKKAGQNYAV